MKDAKLLYVEQYLYPYGRVQKWQFGEHDSNTILYFFLRETSAGARISCGVGHSFPSISWLIGQNIHRVGGISHYFSFKRTTAVLTNISDCRNEVSGYNHHLEIN